MLNTHCLFLKCIVKKITLTELLTYMKKNKFLRLAYLTSAFKFIFDFDISCFDLSPATAKCIPNTLH